jgi:flagellar biosynthetic protein FliP
MRVRIIASLAGLLGSTGLGAQAVAAQSVAQGPLQISINTPTQAGDLALPLQILLLLTLLTFLPAMLIAMTSFTRMIVVLSLLRQALGTQQMPPNQVLIGLALFLTFFVMHPFGVRLHQQVLQPYLAQQITAQEALQQAAVPLREFMLGQTREKDVQLFMQIGRHPRPVTPDDIPITALLPAFIISELKTAFQIGFLLYMPFLILDLVVSSVLLSMGMMMLPPILISLPFKLMLFVLVDGWHLIVGSLIRSFH